MRLKFGPFRDKDADVEKRAIAEDSSEEAPIAHDSKKKGNVLTRIIHVRSNESHDRDARADAEEAGLASDKEDAGEAKYHKLGWKQLVVVLIVTAVALGTLSMPSVFAQLGMVGGVISTVGMGILAMYASYVVGQVKVRYPQVHHYPDIGLLLLPGRAGKLLQMFLRATLVLFLTLLVGGHCLTGTIAWRTITQSDVCKVVWGVVSMVLLFICALPPSFSEMAVLGYIDFISIMAAVLITLIATGINAYRVGIHTIDWHAGAQPGTDFAKGILAVTNILFAFSFALCQFTFMEEMHTPTDFPKAIIVLGFAQIVIYTVVGAVGYAFIGSKVQAPALLSAGHTVSRVAFGVALPVIFISGAICCVTAGRLLMDFFFAKSKIRLVNTVRGWCMWIVFIALVCVVGWVIAQAIPMFNPLLGIISAIFNSAFSLYLPGILWLVVVREGGMFSSAKNICLTLLNVFTIGVGLVIFGAGTYGSVMDMIAVYSGPDVGSAFGCR